MATCRRCGSPDDVHHGLCPECHRLRPDAADVRPPEPPDLEPPHDRPWVARSAFTGRRRRNPRT